MREKTNSQTNQQNRTTASQSHRSYRLRRNLHKRRSIESPAFACDDIRFDADNADLQPTTYNDWSSVNVDARIVASIATDYERQIFHYSILLRTFTNIFCSVALQQGCFAAIAFSALLLRLDKIALRCQLTGEHLTNKLIFDKLVAIGRSIASTNYQLCMFHFEQVVDVYSFIIIIIILLIPILF